MSVPPAPMIHKPTRPLADEPRIDVRDLLIRIIGGILGIMAVLMMLGYLLRAPLMRLSHLFVEHLGGPGVALGFFLPDAFTLPIPNDAFATFGLLGGMPFWSIVAWGSLGSLTGGALGYFIGFKLKHTRRMQHFMTRRGAEAHALVRRYGAVALAAAALTPLPYSIACWTAGALDMRFSRFFAVSLLRILRVAFYLWLIELGVLTWGQLPTA